MTTELSKALRRAVNIQGRPYVITLHEDGFKLVEKGRRLGLELRWDDLVSGQAALAVALSASLHEPVRRKPQVKNRNGPAKNVVVPGRAQRRALLHGKGAGVADRRIRRRRSSRTA